LNEAGDELVSDPTGRWLGYGSAGAQEFHVLDLQRGVIDTVPLPGPLRPSGPNTAMVAEMASVEGILTTGELVVVHLDEVVALSRVGSRPLDSRAYLAPEADLGQGEPVAATQTDGGYELFGLETSTVLATWTPPEDAKWSSVAFTPDLHHAVYVEEVPAPRGRPEPESYIVLGTDTDSERARRIEVPVGYRLIRAAVEASGTYRLVLTSSDSLLTLQVPLPDAMGRALLRAQDAVVSNDGALLVLRDDDNRVAVWDIKTHKQVGTAPPGSAELSQAGSTGSLVISPDGELLVTVFHDRPAKLWRLPNLQPLGDIPLPTASSDFLDSVEDQEIGAAVSFVNDRLALVVYGDGTSTWNLDPLAKRTEAQIPLPDADAPGEWRVVMPGLEQLLTVRGNHVQRNQLSDGELVPGSAFTLGNIPSRDYQFFQPTVDSSGSLMAVFHEDRIEIWDLHERRRVDRLLLPDYTAVDDMRFVEDTDELEIVLMDYRAKNAAGILTQRWHRNSGFDVLSWLGFDDYEVEQISDRNPPPTFAWPRPDGTLETAAPQAWLNRICQTLPDLPYDPPLALPDASWSGDVCANR
jgi:WD40 repeat protein